MLTLSRMLPLQYIAHPLQAMLQGGSSHVHTYASAAGQMAWMEQAGVALMAVRV